MKIRTLHETDVESLLALWNRSMRHDQLSPELLEEKIWDDPDFTTDLALVVEHHNQVIAFIMGVIRPAQPVPLGYIKLLTVDQRFQRKGIGSRLLREIEKIIASSDAGTIRIFESAPNYLVPGIDPRYTRALVFFEKHGYQRFGETWNMEADLALRSFETSKEEAALAQKGVTVRRATAADRSALATFLQKHWPAWIAETSRSFVNEPVSLHLALKSEQILGFAGYDCNNQNTGWFGPMGTAEESRGLGIGGVLLRRCLHDLKAQGKRYATIPWVGPLHFYLHYAGAEISRVFYRYQKTLEQA